jgi:hypothetical protein
MRVYGENYGLSPARFKSKTWKFDWRTNFRDSSNNCVINKKLAKKLGQLFMCPLKGFFNIQPEYRFWAFNKEALALATQAKAVVALILGDRICSQTLFSHIKILENYEPIIKQEC